MDYVFNVILFLIGYFLSAFFLSNILIVLIFSISYTKKLFSAQLLDDNGYENILRLIRITVISNTIILLIAFILVCLLARPYLITFLLGFCIALLFSINKTGENKDNISDYFKTYTKFIDQEKLSKIINTNIPLDRQ